MSESEDGEQGEGRPMISKEEEDYEKNEEKSELDKQLENSYCKSEISNDVEDENLCKEACHNEVSIDQVNIAACHVNSSVRFFTLVITFDLSF